MRIGLELMTTEQMALQAGTFFELWLCTQGSMDSRSLGLDLSPNARQLSLAARLCATGRTTPSQAPEAPGTAFVRPTALVDIEFLPGEALLAGLRTNHFLHLAELKRCVGLTLLAAGRQPLQCTLQHPLLQIEEVAPGRYLIELGRLLAPDRAGQPSATCEQPSVTPPVN